MLATERRLRTNAPPRARVARAPAIRPTRAPSRAAAVPQEQRSDPLAGQLARVVAQRSIAPSAPGPMLQRVPSTRVTQHPTSTARIRGANPQVIATTFQNMRTANTDDSHAVLNDLTFDHLWGGTKSNVTRTGDQYSVRIDRQVPTRTASNIQIQTNGTSISLATVLVSDGLAACRPGDRNAVLVAVRQAFRNSLADGMQWEVYDEPVVETQPVYVKPGKGSGPGKKGGPKKGGGPPKKGGGNQGSLGGGRLVKT